MQKFLGELLNNLDKSYPERLTVEELRTRKISIDTILEAIDGGLISVPLEYAHKIFDKDHIYLEMPCGLSSRGFELLNQVRMKKAIDDLDDSINNFNKSSNRAYNQLNDSIRNFNESSDKAAERLEWLNVVLVCLTVLLSYLTWVTIFNLDIPPLQKDIATVISIIILLILLYTGIKKKWKK